MKEIECRYQWYSKDGIVWTKWFPYHIDSEDDMETEEIIKSLNVQDKKDKRCKTFKREYRVVQTKNAAD